MKTGIILESKDVIKILAEHFGVEEKQIIKTKYSYMIVEEEDGK